MTYGMLNTHEVAIKKRKQADSNSTFATKHCMLMLDSGHQAFLLPTEYNLCMPGTDETATLLLRMCVVEGALVHAYPVS